MEKGSVNDISVSSDGSIFDIVKHQATENLDVQMLGGYISFASLDDDEVWNKKGGVETFKT